MTKVDDKSTRPIIAVVMRFLAPAIFSLSPPESIQFTAPQRIIMMKATPPMVKKRFIILGISMLRLSLLEALAIAPWVLLVCLVSPI